jgi:hypothetical protein
MTAETATERLAEIAARAEAFVSRDVPDQQYERAVWDREWLIARVVELEGQLDKVPDVDGWTVHNRPGGLMLTHDTDADCPTLLGDMHLPVGAVLAFIADTEEPTVAPDSAPDLTEWTAEMFEAADDIDRRWE